HRRGEGRPDRENRCHRQHPRRSDLCGETCPAHPRGDETTGTAPAAGPADRARQGTGTEAGSRRVSDPEGVANLVRGSAGRLSLTNPLRSSVDVPTAGSLTTSA